MADTSTALLIDFGSTYTKLRAVDLDQGKVLASGQGPSTVTTDINEGMTAALGDLESHMGRLPTFKHRFASSSAAGGLKMVTIGLVKELTAEAARLAALGAGAKLSGTYAYRLTSDDVAAIERTSPDILLLAGGTDGGNSAVLMHNCDALAKADISCPVVFAGNRTVADYAKETLSHKGRFLVCENVMPEFGQLNIEPARGAIREVFIDHIVHAKGIDKAASAFDAVLMPTPAAVLEGAKLMSEGTANHEGLGPLIVVDVGGATTDIHSIADGAPEKDGVVPIGLPEPRVKRTVEGDLGMRHNIDAIVEMARLEALAGHAELDETALSTILDAYRADVERLPASDEEMRADGALGYFAVKFAMSRHAGRTEVVQTVDGPKLALRGKDLTGVPTVIGTGGVLVHGGYADRVLKGTIFDESDMHSLRPRNPRFLLDRGYMLYAVGLIGTVDPDAAFKLGRNSLADAE